MSALLALADAPEQGPEWGSAAIAVCAIAAALGVIALIGWIRRRM